MRGFRPKREQHTNCVAHDRHNCSGSVLVRLVRRVSFGTEFAARVPLCQFHYDHDAGHPDRA